MEAAGGAVDERRLSPPFINSIAGTVGEPSGVLSSLLGSRRVGIGEAAAEGEGGGVGSSFFDLRSVRIMMGGVSVAVVVLCCVVYNPHSPHSEPLLITTITNYNNLYPDGCACCCFLCCWWFDFGVTNTGLRLTRILKKETGEFLFREIKGDPCVVVGGWNGRFL